MCTCTARDAQKALSKKQKISGNFKKQREGKEKRSKEKKRKGEKRKKEGKKNGGPRGCPTLRCRYKLSKRNNKKTCPLTILPIVVLQITNSKSMPSWSI